MSKIIKYSRIILEISNKQIVSLELGRQIVYPLSPGVFVTFPKNYCQPSQPEGRGDCPRWWIMTLCHHQKASAF